MKSTISIKFRSYRNWKLASKIRFYFMCILEFFIVILFVAAIVDTLSLNTLLVCAFTAIMLGICGNFKQQRYSELKQAENLKNTDTD